MMITSSSPASSASSTINKIAGLATPSRSMIGNSSFFVALVAGKRRVPKPAAGIKALRTLGPDCRIILDDMDDCVLVLLRASDELGRSIALRSDPFTAPYKGFQRCIIEHFV